MKPKNLLIILAILALIILTYILLVNIIFANALTKTLSPIGKDKSDQEMATYFLDHKEDFASLNEDFIDLKSKGLRRIDETWTDPKDLSNIGISEKDLQDIRTRFKKLDIPRGVNIYDNNIEYITYSYGLSIGGRLKGYLYSEIVPSNFYKCDNEKGKLLPFDLEEDKPQNLKCSHTFHTKIEENWYIFDEYED